MKKIKVGIVGMGAIGVAHWDALRRIPEVEIAAVADNDPIKTKEAARRFQIPAWHTSVEAMLPSVDVVHNCTPNQVHDAVNRAVIARGKHIYAEKPLSQTAADAFAVWKMAEAAGVVHGLNHQYRMYAAVQEMRVRAQKAGRVFLVSGRYHQQSGLYPTDFSDRMTQQNHVWALSDICTHLADLACCVIDRRIEKVFANVQATHQKRMTPEGEWVHIDSDDLSTILAVFQGGAQGVFSVSKVSAGHMNDLAICVDAQECGLRWEQESPDRLSITHKYAPNEMMTISPELVDPAARDLVNRPGGHPPGWNDALYFSIREFYTAVRGEIAPSAMRCATFEDGFEGMAFVEAALRSAKSGGWESILRGVDAYTI